MSFTPSKSILRSLKHVQPLRSLSHVTKTKTPSQNPSTTHNTGFTHDETLRIPEWGSYASSSKRQTNTKTPSQNPSTTHNTGFTHDETLRIPEWGSYASSSKRQTNQVFAYFMVGAYTLGSVVGAKATVQDFLVNMSASADVLAQAKVEVGLESIPEGKNVIIKWRGKPVFIRHRTKDEIDEAHKIDWRSLRDPQPDEDRVQKPEWLVMLGVCTHLGCVPIGEAGDYGGWFCPCHGSHYDISGRARKGPAPLNLEVPEYHFATEDSLVIW